MTGAVALLEWPAFGSWMAEALIASSLLLILVLAIREPVARHFGPRIAYLLWLLPALRMVLPPLPESWSAPKVEAVQTIAVILGDVARAPVATGADLPAMLASVWMVGALLFFSWHFLAYVRFSRAVLATATPLFSHNRIRVEASSAVSSPMAFGLFGKTIIVPADFAERYDPTEQRFAIDHELTHHRRGDLAVNLVAMGLLALHWFNPLAHIAWRAFRLDQEAACDAIVLDGASPEDRHAYGSALFKSAAGSVPLAACTISAPATLKKRLRRIIEGRALPTRAKSGVVLTAILVLGGLSLTASGGIAAKAGVGIDQNGPILALGGVVVDLTPNRIWADATVKQKPARTVYAHADAVQPVSPPDAPLPPAAPSASSNNGIAPPDQAEIAEPVEAAAPIPAPEPAPSVQALAQVHRIVLKQAGQPRSLSCADGGTPRIVKGSQADGQGGIRSVTVVLCTQAAAANQHIGHSEMRRALESARASLLADEVMAAAGRDRLIASLDREISRLAEHSRSLQ